MATKPLSKPERAYATALRDAIAEARQCKAPVTASWVAEDGSAPADDELSLDDDTRLLRIPLSRNSHAMLLRIQAMMDDADPESDILALLERALTLVVEEG